jgi:hypothetical protein
MLTTWDTTRHDRINEKAPFIGSTLATHSAGRFRHQHRKNRTGQFGSHSRRDETVTQIYWILSYDEALMLHAYLESYQPGWGKTNQARDLLFHL